MPEIDEPYQRHDLHDAADPRFTWSIGPERVAHVVLNQAPRLGTTRLVTIDGSAGAGKSTYAEQLVDAMQRSGCTTATIQMDDLYNGWDGLRDPLWDQRVPPGLLEP